MPPKGWKKEQVVSEEQPGAVVAPAIVPVLDAGAGLYRDKSGPVRGVPLSEGRDNFSAVTHEAHKTVQLAKEHDDAN